MRCTTCSKSMLTNSSTQSKKATSVSTLEGQHVRRVETTLKVCVAYQKHTEVTTARPYQKMITKTFTISNSVQLMFSLIKSLRASHSHLRPTIVRCHHVFMVETIPSLITTVHSITHSHSNFASAFAKTLNASEHVSRRKTSSSMSKKKQLLCIHS